WKKNPQAARGGLVAGVLRDGDWNIALKWLGDNKIPNNPDESTYDPEALNWVNASDYIEAAQKYVSGFCTELTSVKTKKKEKDGAYWYKYFKVQSQKDKQGIEVELGGSAVNNLADNQQLFGLAAGSTNLFAATYTVFGNIVKSQYPNLVPSFYPVDQILDT